MGFLKKHPLFRFFLLGLILRILLLFLDYGWDVHNHIVWAKDLWTRGFRGFYETQSSEVYASLYPNYPPLSLFLFYLSYPLQTIIYKIAWWLNITVPVFPSNLIFFLKDRVFLAGMMKLPAILADLGIAWLCLLFARKLTSNPTSPFGLRGASRLNDRLTTILVLFNPAFIYNSALWGQIDSIPIFFVLLSTYLLLYSDKYLISNLFFVMGILVKPTALVFFPVYLVLFFKKYKLIKFLKTGIFSLLVFYLSFIPFLANLNNPLLPFSIFSEKIMAAQSLPYVTNGAFNFWVLIAQFAGIKDTAPFLFGISYRLWGYFITGFFTVFILFKLFRHSGNPERSRRGLQNRFWISQNDIFFAFFLIAFAAFLFLTKMHERYSLLPLPFLLLAAVKNKKLVKWFIILSLISLLNHYHSWPVPKLGHITTIIFFPVVSYVITLLNIGIFFHLLNKFRRLNYD